jgi:hypothetical protein
MTEPRQGVDFEEAKQIAYDVLASNGEIAWCDQDADKLAATVILALLARAEAAEEREREIGRRGFDLHGLAERNMKTATGEGYTYWQGYRDGALAAVEPLAEHHPEAGEQ